MTSRIENPCVGGSIPPQATKEYVVKTKAYRNVSLLYFLALSTKCGGVLNIEHQIVTSRQLCHIFAKCLSL